MGDIDVRVLTLKRWNPEQRNSFYCMDTENLSKYGDYICFENYSSFDITKVESNVVDFDCIFYNAQKIAEDKRKNIYSKHTNCDIYVQQSIVIFGSDSDFWNQDTEEYLFVTMIQLSNKDDVSICNVSNQIRQFLSESISDDKFSIYYSLDFCDLVLLIKDLNLSKVQDILWNMTLSTNNNFEHIRDTVTIHGIRSRNFKNKIMSVKNHSKYDNKMLINEPSSISYDDKISLLININLQNLKCLKNLKTNLIDKFNCEDNSYRILGRSDLSIILTNINYSTFLDVICTIEEISYSYIDKNENFSYELKILSKYNIDYGEGNNTCIYTEFCSNTKTFLNKLFENYIESLNDNNEDTRGYASEVTRSLIALLKNGFAEEFVLSTIKSFIGYLNFSIEFMKNNENEKKDQFYKFQKEYFQSLNTLSHCMMHGERQFIQAPAFNATLFDIQPKLVCFYTAIANKITNLLNDEKDRSFFFLFCPDFRPDIYVNPISFGIEENNKICIIYLNEKMFYNPVNVIQNICHEIAHYVGNNCRYRKERAKNIIESICAYMLYITLPSDCYDDKLITKFSESFSEQVLIEYDEWIKLNDIHENQKYLLTLFGNFLDETQFLTELLNRNSFVENLKNVLVETILRNNIYVDKLIEKQERNFNNNYLTKLYNNCNKNVVLHNLVSSLILRIKLKMEQMIRLINIGGEEVISLSPFKFVENLLQAFSEAYSDLKMVQLLSIKNITDYKNIFYYSSENILDLKNDKAYDAFQVKLRLSGVCSIIKNKVMCYDNIPYQDETSKKIFDFCLKKLYQYLRICYNNTDIQYIANNNLSDIIKTVNESNAQDIFVIIRNEIINYRNNLEQYIKDNKSN